MGSISRLREARKAFKHRIAFLDKRIADSDHAGALQFDKAERSALRYTLELFDALDEIEADPKTPVFITEKLQELRINERSLNRMIGKY